MARHQEYMTRNFFFNLKAILFIIPIALSRNVEDENPLLSEISDELAQFSEDPTWEDAGEVRQTNYDKRVERPKYDPAIRYIGLGKRQKEKPKYNPGWKFIGLGKKRMVVEDQASHHDPYLSILALSNLSDFFHHLKEEIQYVKNGEPKTEDIIPGGPKQSYYNRGSKKSWKTYERPVYDPSWAMTGLGRK